MILAGIFPERIFPKDISPNGKAMDEMFYQAVKLTGTAFAVVVLVLGFCIVVYRARAGHKARYMRGNSKPALMMMVGVSLLVFFGIDVPLAFQDNAAYKAMYGDSGKPAAAEDDALVIHVIGKQFEWNFRYAGADGKFDTKDDLTTAATLYIPKGRKILLQIRSFDVIHSFFLPNLRRKQDVIPGLTVKMSFVTTDTGKYDITCAEMCGTNHGTMVGTLNVMTKEDFEKWTVERGKRTSARPEIWKKWPVANAESGS